MNASGISRSQARRARTTLVALLAPLFVVACEQGAEGDRCNPDLSSGECTAGLVCAQPLPCAENYCCPPDAAAATNAYCLGLPSACPSEDAGEDGGDDAAIDAGLDATRNVPVDAGASS